MGQRCLHILVVLGVILSVGGICSPTWGQCTLTYGDPGGAKVVWPYGYQTASDIRLVELVHAPLFYRGADAEVRSDLVDLDSLERLPSGDILQFRLRSGLRWSDHSQSQAELTASDVTSTFNYLSSGGTPKIGSFHLANFSLIEYIEMDPSDPLIVRVKYVESLDQTAMLTPLINYYVLPAHVFRTRIMETYMIDHGTAPISIGRWHLHPGPTDFDLKLLRNESYLGAETPFERIEGLLEMREEEIRDKMMQSTLELVVRVPLDPHIFSQIKALENWNEFPLGRRNWAMLIINWRETGKPALRDPNIGHRLRLAMDAAINKEEIANVIFGKGHYQIVSGPFTSDSYARATDCPPRGHDPNLARQALQAAGYVQQRDGVLRKGPSELRLRVLVPQDIRSSQNNQIFELIETNLAAVGIKLERINKVAGYNLEESEWDLYYSEYRSPLSWSCWNIFHSDGELNDGRFSDPELDRLLSQFEEAPSEEMRATIGPQIHRYMKENLPAIFMWAPEHRGMYDFERIHFYSSAEVIFSQWEDWECLED